VPPSTTSHLGRAPPVPSCSPQFIIHLRLSSLHPLLSLNPFKHSLAHIRILRVREIVNAMAQKDSPQGELVDQTLTI
jgi:hypothetical protein